MKVRRAKPSKATVQIKTAKDGNECTFNVTENMMWNKTEEKVMI